MNMKLFSGLTLLAINISSCKSEKFEVVPNLDYGIGTVIFYTNATGGPRISYPHWRKYAARP